ncbi:uncharacterized protein [Venturia canescens]|uniref:uncharacterized protein n=1 Tax=Venturia canescens TaxID=32260 RepID=UPI001C9C46AD|nr:uncharacterized protein LOC122417068 [Venturia canescens]
MKPKYRVEAFIVPTTITEDELSTTNEIDDVKIANIKMKLASPSKSLESSPIKNGIDENLVNGIYELDEPIYDEPIYDELSIVKRKLPRLPNFTEFRKLPSLPELPKLPNSPVRNKYEDIALTLAPKIPIRSSSLMSIDERGETDGILEEFCFHGYKNGCTASTQRPEEVSEEIFQDNWLRRLESLRERESSLSEKETLLQERERLLFKKERELRILERLVREKLKEAELRLKLCQSSQSIESTNEAKTRSSESSLKSQAPRSKIDNSASYHSTRNFVEEENLKGSFESENLKMALVLNDHHEKGTLKNPPNSRSSLWSNCLAPSKPAEPSIKLRSETTGTSFPVSSAYNSLRMYKPRIRPRVSYDDLDSTLSADVGDSSFVVTSKKFDPAIFKKPQAFTRSASERRTRLDSQQDVPKDSHHVKYPPHSGFHRISQDDKILKRTVENIAVTQDENVKYQDYGLIDKRIDSNNTDDARHSYLNLERGADSVKSEKPSRNPRDRPISWNEDTNEWLRKKRQAYNMANLRLSHDQFENKENSSAANAAKDKLKKDAKKKETRPRKFGIFR